MYVIPLTKSGAIKDDTNTSQRDPTLLSTGVDFNDFEMIEFFDIDYYLNYNVSADYSAKVPVVLKTYKAINVYCDLTDVTNIDNRDGSLSRPFNDFYEAYTSLPCLISHTCGCLFRLRVKGNINLFNTKPLPYASNFDSIYSRILVSSYTDDSSTPLYISFIGVHNSESYPYSYSFSFFKVDVRTEAPFEEKVFFPEDAYFYYGSIINNLYFCYESEITLSFKYGGARTNTGIIFASNGLAWKSNNISIECYYDNVSTALNSFSRPLWFLGYQTIETLLMKQTSFLFSTNCAVPFMGAVTVDDFYCVGIMSTDTITHPSNISFNTILYSVHCNDLYLNLTGETHGGASNIIRTSFLENSKIEINLSLCSCLAAVPDIRVSIGAIISTSSYGFTTEIKSSTIQTNLDGFYNITTVLVNDSDYYNGVSVSNSIIGTVATCNRYATNTSLLFVAPQTKPVSFLNTTLLNSASSTTTYSQQNYCESICIYVGSFSNLQLINTNITTVAKSKNSIVTSGTSYEVEKACSVGTLSICLQDCYKAQRRYYYGSLVETTNLCN